MKKPKNKDELIRWIEEERAILEQTLARLDQDQMLQPGVEDDRSVKDILGHIVAWEGKMCQWLQEAVRGEIPERPAPGMTWDDLDLLNAQIDQEFRERSLDDVLKTFKSSYLRALAAVREVPEEDLFEPGRFEWRQGDPLWYMVGGNTFWHYQEHGDGIRRWLDNAE